MTLQEQYELLEKTIRNYNPSADFAQIRAAFEYADKCHIAVTLGDPHEVHMAGEHLLVLGGTKNGLPFLLTA